MEEQLITLDKLVQSIHKREKSMSVYECYDVAMKLLLMSELTNISTALQGINFELNKK